MPKKSISSLELTALINELQFLVNGKLSQIYHQDEKELLLQFHVTGRGKQLLKIIAGKLLCITENKDAPLKPSSFCMQLRKYLEGAFLKALYQKDAERVVVFELEKKEGYYLIIELFSKGNVVLTDKEYQIIGVLEEQIWKDRAVKPKEKYIFPVAGHNWKTIREKEMETVLHHSDKRNLATALATEVGLGGTYAEEVCLRNGIDKDKLPKDITTEEVKKLVKTILALLKMVETPSGYIYEEEMAPFPLQGQKIVQETKTYSEAIDGLNPFQIVSPYVQKIRSLERNVLDQEETLKKHEGAIALNKRKGELIYEKYMPLRKLLDIVAEMKKTSNWHEIEAEMKKEKRIKRVDLKTKKIVVDL